MGEWLTLATIWVAMFAWTGGVVCSAVGFRGDAGATARVFWTIGLVFYLGHVLLAYANFYQWSHGVAWQKTARDTAEVTGVSTGVGLLVNFGFGVVLFLDVISRWRNSQRRASGWVDGFVLFMIVNGAIVFGEGAVRWAGAVCLAAILASLLLRWRNRSATARGNS